ncbi:hypothetical protein KIPB_013973, partial [Kipferlia bialata]
DWVHRILTRSQAPRAIFVVAVMYLGRMDRVHNLHLTRNNVYRMFLVAVMLASKTYEDNTYRNCDWAIIGLRHYPTSALTRMELELLSWLGYRTLVPPQEFVTVLNTTFGMHPTYQDLPRPVSK